MASPSLQRGRISNIGNCYVITTVTARRARIFECPENARELTRWLHCSDHEGRTESLAWAVMPDHLHWMFFLRETSLSTVVRTMKSHSARAINQCNGSQGPIWQPGYYDQQQRDERQFRTEALYIMANPVRAGLATRLEEYPFAWCRWSLSDQPAALRSTPTP
ncbi:transposase [Stenotrophomonas sp.]|uniref:REP-associated tyrosine transposase n=1 Tax=Stenotrophomonas sp. TaxID=69392 RepID=UPI0028AFAB13|nr:transposase [Stenotrophomonas sp.]